MEALKRENCSISYCVYDHPTEITEDQESYTSQGGQPIGPQLVAWGPSVILAKSKQVHLFLSHSQSQRGLQGHSCTPSQPHSSLTTILQNSTRL